MICNYEAAANPADHKVESIIPQTNLISWKPSPSKEEEEEERGEKERTQWRLFDKHQKVKEESSAVYRQIVWTPVRLSTKKSEDHRPSEVIGSAKLLLSFLWGMKCEGFIWVKP